MFLMSRLSTGVVGRFLLESAPNVFLHSFLYGFDSLPRQIDQPVSWWDETKRITPVNWIVVAIAVEIVIAGSELFRVGLEEAA